MQAGDAMLAGLGLAAGEQLRPKLLYTDVIEDIADQHAVIINRNRQASMILPGETLLVCEMVPALYAAIAANEAEKAAPGPDARRRPDDRCGGPPLHVGHHRERRSRPCRDRASAGIDRGTGRIGSADRDGFRSASLTSSNLGALLELARCGHRQLRSCRTVDASR